MSEDGGWSRLGRFRPMNDSHFLEITARQPPIGPAFKHPVVAHSREYGASHGAPVEVKIFIRSTSDVLQFNFSALPAPRSPRIFSTSTSDRTEATVYSEQFVNPQIGFNNMRSNVNLLKMRVRRVLLLLVTLAACSEASTASGNDPIRLTRDTAVGTRFGSAGPRSCSAKDVPMKGPPSSQQIAAYVICVREKEEGSREGAAGNNFLNLVDNVVISAVSKARPYNPKEYYLDSPIDVSKPVYDIKGSLDIYSCHWVGSGYGSPRGKNCSVEHQRNAQGVCYLDTFGNWACNLVDRSGNVSVERGVAPPA